MVVCLVGFSIMIIFVIVIIISFITSIGIFIVEFFIFAAFVISSGAKCLLYCLPFQISFKYFTHIFWNRLNLSINPLISTFYTIL